jgi:hypothetical protein
MSFNEHNFLGFECLGGFGLVASSVQSLSASASVDAFPEHIFAPLQNLSFLSGPPPDI